MAILGPQFWVAAFSHYPRFEFTAAFLEKVAGLWKKNILRLWSRLYVRVFEKFLGDAYQDVNTDATSSVEEKETLPLTPVQKGWP